VDTAQPVHHDLYLKYLMGHEHGHHA
jgi:hypothetical protein